MKTLVIFFILVTIFLPRDFQAQQKPDNMSQELWEELDKRLIERLNQEHDRELFLRTQKSSEYFIMSSVQKAYEETLACQKKLLESKGRMLSEILPILTEDEFVRKAPKKKDAKEFEMYIEEYLKVFQRYYKDINETDRLILKNEISLSILQMIIEGENPNEILLKILETPIPTNTE